MTQNIASRAALVPVLVALAACASGSGRSTAFVPAPAPAAGLRTAGYLAPEIDRTPRTASAMQARPVSFTAAGDAAETRAAASRPLPNRLSAMPDAEPSAAPEVPAAPARDWSRTAEARAPLPDLDGIVVTREAPPTRSVMPERLERTTPAEPAPATTASAVRAGHAIHLASYRRPEQAAAGWQVLTRDHPGVLTALAPARATVDLPGRGRFHRLLAGPLAADDAEAACDALERDGSYCAVVAWNGAPL